jgi:Fibronectin type III domain
VPVGIEVIGGPYLVYRQTGVIVRLGDPPVTVRAGGAVDRPTYTDDGTVWVHRPDTGAVCALRRGSDALDCAHSTGPQLPGALAIATAAAYVDTVDDAAQVVDGTASGAAAALSVDLPDTALIGDRDTRGRLPVVATGPNRLILVDSAAVPRATAAGPAVTIDLGDGTFSAPMASDGIVALIDETRHRLLTFDLNGRPLGSADLPGDGTAALSRGGDGRIYLDGADGAATFVVGTDGKVTSVRTGGATSAVSAPQPRDVLPAPPPRRTGPPPVVRDVPTGPITEGPGPVPSAQPSAPAQPAPTVPGPPTAVRATLGANGTVVVSWAPPGGGRATSYVVTSNDGTSQQATATSTSFTGLSAGSRHTFTVVAGNDAGSGPPSNPSNAVVIPVPRPGAPTGLQLDVRRQGARSITVTATWQRPNLNGGQLDHYVIRAKDGNGRVVLDTTSTTETSPAFSDDGCLGPYSVTVTAVTGVAGSGQTATGPAAAATTLGGQCTVNMSIAASAVLAQSTTITMTQLPPTGTFGGYACTLTANGAAVWSGLCGSSQLRPQDADVTGLTPDTTYRLVLTTEQPVGQPRNSNTLTITTPAA